MLILLAHARTHARTHTRTHTHIHTGTFLKSAGAWERLEVARYYEMKDGAKPSTPNHKPQAAEPKPQTPNPKPAAPDTAAGDVVRFGESTRE